MKCDKGKHLDIGSQHGLLLENIGVASIRQLRMWVIKIETFKGGRLMW